MVSIEMATEIANRYGIEINKVNDNKCVLSYINEYGDKIKINSDNYTEDMKSICFQLENGFIIADEIKGKMIQNEIKMEELK